MPKPSSGFLSPASGGTATTVRGSACRVYSAISTVDSELFDGTARCFKLPANIPIVFAQPLYIAGGLSVKSVGSTPGSAYIQAG